MIFFPLKQKSSSQNLSRIVLMVLLDVLLINLSFFISFALRFDMHIPAYELAKYANAWWIVTLIHLGIFALFRMYHILWEFASVDEFITVAATTFIAMGASYGFGAITYAIQPKPVLYLLPRTVYAIAWVLELLLVAGFRYSYRLVRRSRRKQVVADKASRRRVMVVGAGMGGSIVIKELTNVGYRNGQPVLVVDDDPAKNRTKLNGVPVRSGTQNIPDFVAQYQIDEIIIAIPSASSQQLRSILDHCAQTSAHLKIMQQPRDVEEGKRTGAIRDVNIADLLFRDEVHLDTDSISGYLKDKVVLVTGGGGSIGSELCRQIARFSPRRLIIFDICENHAYELQRELQLIYGRDFPVRLLIGSVQDKARVDAIFAQNRPDVVFHAAAHKHVPAMEECSAEAIKNNVGGTLNVARCADRYQVSRFVLLSTDKAVNPTTVMGASKRVTELLLQMLAAHSRTQYMAVRFGNVLGSMGSIIPIFRQQIAMGGPVTITHMDMTRYFMTIPEAAQLVLQAGAMGQSGDIFVLDMGSPVKIIDLIRNMIRLSGYEPDIDIAIREIGVRPGEKIHEELMTAEERAMLDHTTHSLIWIAKPTGMDIPQFSAQLESLLETAIHNPDGTVPALKAMLPNFDHEDPIGQSQAV